MFAPDVTPAQKRAAKRRFYVPPFSYHEWQRAADVSTTQVLVADASVDEARAVRVGSLDPGSVSFGWGVVEFAPIVTAPLDSSCDQGWIRVPRASEHKNCVESPEPYETMPWAFRLVHWEFVRMFESKKATTKEHAVAFAARHVYTDVIATMASFGVDHIVIEQQLGMQNVMATCLSHVFQALCIVLCPDVQVHFVAPQLTVPLFVRMLPIIPLDFPFDPRKVEDLKNKPEKKYASGCCAAFMLVSNRSLADGSSLQTTWQSVPREPDPKYDDICDQMWNAVAFWNKIHPAKRGRKQK